MGNYPGISGWACKGPYKRAQEGQSQRRPREEGSRDGGPVAPSGSLGCKRRGQNVPWSLQKEAGLHLVFLCP